MKHRMLHQAVEETDTECVNDSTLQGQLQATQHGNPSTMKTTSNLDWIVKRPRLPENSLTVKASSKYRIDIFQWSKISRVTSKWTVSNWRWQQALCCNSRLYNDCNQVKWKHCKTFQVIDCSKPHVASRNSPSQNETWQQKFQTEINEPSLPPQTNPFKTSQRHTSPFSTAATEVTPVHKHKNWVAANLYCRNIKLKKLKGREKPEKNEAN